jgi:hypothetical protein
MDVVGMLDTMELETYVASGFVGRLLELCILRFDMFESIGGRM